MGGRVKKMFDQILPDSRAARQAGFNRKVLSPMFFMVMLVLLSVVTSTVGWLTFGALPEWSVTVSFVLNGIIFMLWFAYFLAYRPVSFGTIIGYFGVWFMFIVPFSQAATFEWKWVTSTTDFDANDILYTNFVVLVAYLTMFLAYAFAKKRGQASALSQPAYLYAWRPLGVVAAFGFFLAIAVLFAAAFGGPIGLGIRGARSLATDSGAFSLGGLTTALISVGSNIMRPGFLFLALAVFALPFMSRDGLPRRDGWVRYGVISFPLLFLAIFCNLPTATARYYLVPVAWLLLAISIRNRLVSTCCVSIFLIGGVYLSAVASNLSGFDVDLVEAFGSVERYYYFVGHFNSWETILLNIAWVARDGLAWGVDLVAPLLFWVPRSLWEGKPQSASIVFSEEFLSTTFDFGVHNVGVSTLGTFYKSFSFPGALLYGLVGGVFAGYMDGRHGNYREKFSQLGAGLRAGFPSLTIYPFLAGAFFIFLRGQVWIAFQFLVSVALCYLIIAKVALIRLPVSAQEHGAARPALDRTRDAIP